VTRRLEIEPGSPGPEPNVLPTKLSLFLLYSCPSSCITFGATLQLSGVVNPCTDLWFDIMIVSCKFLSILYK